MGADVVKSTSVSSSRLIPEVVPSNVTLPEKVVFSPATLFMKLPKVILLVAVLPSLMMRLSSVVTAVIAVSSLIRLVANVLTR